MAITSPIGLTSPQGLDYTRWSLEELEDYKDIMPGARAELARRRAAPSTPRADKRTPGPASAPATGAPPDAATVAKGIGGQDTSFMDALAAYQDMMPEDEKGKSTFSADDLKQGYDLYRAFQNPANTGETINWTSGRIMPGDPAGASGPIAAPAASTGLAAVPGGAGWGTAAGGAAAEAGVAPTLGGLSNAPVSGAGGAGAGFFGSAGFALAPFYLGMLFTMYRMNKDKKETAKDRAPGGRLHEQYTRNQAIRNYLGG